MQTEKPVMDTELVKILYQTQIVSRKLPHALYVASVSFCITV